MFYDKYVQLCNQRGISLSAAAQEAGVSKSLVTKWKANKTKNPSPEVLQKLSAYFGVPVSELLGEKNEKEKPTIPEDDGLTENQKVLIEFAKFLTEDQAVLALRLLKSLVEAD